VRSLGTQLQLAGPKSKDHSALRSDDRRHGRRQPPSTHKLDVLATAKTSGIKRLVVLHLASGRLKGPDPDTGT